MDKGKELQQRKSTRLHKFDYNTPGAYFLTICTENRRRILSDIVGDDVLGVPKSVELFPYGKIADKHISELSEFYANIKVDKYVIMPNHIHIILRVLGDGSPRTSTPTRQTSSISHFVSTFKRFCNKEYGRNIWQRGFYDHVIRNYDDYVNIKKYILQNPTNWYYDELYS